MLYVVIGIPSSRKIEQKTYEDIALRFLSAGHHPDHDTIASFRRTHLDAIKGLFLQVLVLCREAASSGRDTYPSTARR